MADLALKFTLASAFRPALKLQYKANVEYKGLGYKKISDPGGKIGLTESMPEFMASRIL